MALLPRSSRPTVAALAVAAALVALPAPASARTPPYTPQQACGPGFRLLTDSAISTIGRVRTQRGILALLHNRSTGQWCAAAIKTWRIGAPTAMWVNIQGPAGRKDVDQGRFRYYAGPVKISAKANRCIYVSAGIPGRRGSSGWFHFHRGRQIDGPCPRDRG